jgi:hypothetical protein
MPVILVPIVVVAHYHELSRATWRHLQIFTLKITGLYVILLCKIGLQNYRCIKIKAFRDMVACNLVEVYRRMWANVLCTFMFRIKK